MLCRNSLDIGRGTTVLDLLIKEKKYNEDRKEICNSAAIHRYRSCWYALADAIGGERSGWQGIGRR